MWQERVLSRQLEAVPLHLLYQVIPVNPHLQRRADTGVSAFLKSIITTGPPGLSIFFIRPRWLAWFSTWCHVSQMSSPEGHGPGGSDAQSCPG